MAIYNRTNKGPICYCAGVLSASLVIYLILQPGTEKSILRKLNRTSKLNRVPKMGNSDNWTQSFSFVPKGLVNCDDLFRGKSPARLEFQNEYRMLTDGIQTILDPLRGQVEGHSGSLQKQTFTYQTLAKADFVKTVCETGFNAGHSAFLFLSTKADIHVYSFDLGAHQYGRPAANLIKKTFPGRLNITWGDSKVTVPAFAKSNPHIQCDILIVDGGHAYREAKADLRNLRALANKSNNIVIIDDYPANALPGVKRAWEEELSDKQLQEHFKCNFYSAKNRGFTVGKYINL